MMQPDHAILNLCEVARTFEWGKWAMEIPYLRFPSHWHVKIIPPFITGVIRFIVKTDKTADRSVSVDLDCYDRAGFVGEPYWEVYPYRDAIKRRCLLKETERLLNYVAESLLEIETQGSREAKEEPFPSI